MALKDPSRQKWMESFLGWCTVYVIEQRFENASDGEVEKAVRVARPLVYQFEISTSQVTFLFTANTESPSMKSITRYIDQLTNKIIPNGPAQTGTRHQDGDPVTLPYSSTALSSSSFPSRPGSSTRTDSRSKRFGKKSTNERRCTSFAQFPRNDC